MFNFNMTDYDRKVYEAELKDFLPENVIDFHLHTNKKEFDSWGAHNGGSSWTDLIADEMTTENMLDALQQLLPGKNVTPLVFGGCLCDIDTVNDYVRDDSRKYQFPTLYRTSYDMPKDELIKRVKEGGFLGLKPYLSNCPPYIPPKETRIFDFLPPEHLEAANENGWIVMLHIPRDGRLKDPVNLAQLLEIEEKYPNVKLVVAHIGRAYSKEDIGNAFDLLGKTKKMVFDFTANVSDDAIRACIEAVGTKRLIFGSDLPIAIMRMYRITEDGVYYNVVPRGLYGNVSGEPHMRETDETDVTLMYYEQIRAMKRVAEDLKLSKEDVENIFYGNAKRLLNEMNYNL